MGRRGRPDHLARVIKFGLPRAPHFCRCCGEGVQPVLTPSWISAFLVAAALEIDWKAPPECPAPEVVHDAVSAELHGSDGATPLHATGRITKVDARYELELWVTGEGVRWHSTLADPSCGLLTDAAVLKIAAAFDRVPRPAPAPAPSVPAPPEQRATASEPGMRCRPRPRQSRPGPPCIGLLADAAGQVGPLPRLGAGFGGGLTLLWPRLRVHVEGQAWLERETSQSPPNAALRLAAGSVHACARLGMRSIEVPLCGGVEIGGMRGRGLDIPFPRSSTLVWAALVVQGGVAWSPHPRLALFARGAFLGNLLPLEFSVDGRQTVYRVPRVGGRFGLGVEVRLFSRRR